MLLEATQTRLRLAGNKWESMAACKATCEMSHWRIKRATVAYDVESDAQDDGPSKATKSNNRLYDIEKMTPVLCLEHRRTF